MEKLALRLNLKSCWTSLVLTSSLHYGNVHWNPHFLHAIAQCQLALSQDMNKPLTQFYSDYDIDCEKVVMKNLVLVMVKAQLQMKNN